MHISQLSGHLRTSERVHRFGAVQQVLGLLLMVFSLTMLPPLLVSWLYDDGAAQAFGTALWITLAFGAAIWWPVRRAHADLKLRDGFLVTVLFWAVLSVFGSIPFHETDSGWPSYTDALFESVSGLTTTGATAIASGLDRLPPSINFYRAQLQWLGGMGMIVLAVAILPMLGVGGMQLLRAETPGPMKDAKLTPRIASTARALWLIYVALTVVCILVYLLLDMTVFDAICHGMTTVATGGFSTHDASFGYWNSAGIETACMIFMVLASANFALHFTVWNRRNPLVYFRDAEFRTFLLLVIGFGLVVCLPLYFTGTYPDFATAVRKGLFHVISYGTTSGFGTADPSPWPMPLPLILMLCAFMVGCAGSTAGGVKVVRLMLFTRQAFREMQRLIHPNAVLPLKLSGKVVPDEVVYAIGGFFSVYIGFTILLSFLMMMTGLDPIYAFSAVAATINNLGPGLGALNASMSSVSDPGKWILIFSMLLGRLEIFTLLIIFTPGFWRR